MITFAWPWIREARLMTQIKPDHAERRRTYRNDPKCFTPVIFGGVLGIGTGILFGEHQEPGSGIFLFHRKRLSDVAEARKAEIFYNSGDRNSC